MSVIRVGYPLSAMRFLSLRGRESYFDDLVLICIDGLITQSFPNASLPIRLAILKRKLGLSFITIIFDEHFVVPAYAGMTDYDWALQKYRRFVIQNEVKDLNGCVGSK